MKRTILLLLMTAPLWAMATEPLPQDTTVFVNGRKLEIREGNGKINVRMYETNQQGETVENEKIFEGIYLDGQSSEQRISVSIPFTKKKKNYHPCFDPHASGFYMGYAKLPDGLKLSNANGVDLVSSKSWEWGFTLFEGALTLSRNNQWGLTSSLGWGYTSYRLDGNVAFRKEGTSTGLYTAPGEAPYTKSRLRYFHFRIPIAIEWQQRISHKGPLFASFGPEIEIRHGIKSIAKTDGKSRTVGKQLNVHPVGINLLAQVGFGDWGAYLRYSTYGLFENNKGPEVNPISFGLQWYW